MPYDKLSGVYFTTNVAVNSAQEKVPLFIVQTSTAITELDGQIKKFTDVSNFETLVNGKSLTQSLQFIKDALTEANINQFYVYSLKTETSDAFKEVLVSTANYTDIQDVVYIEETKGTMLISQKISALTTGANKCAEYGTFRIPYTIPYGTVKKALEDDEDNTDDVTIINALKTNIAEKNINNGRCGVILPTDEAGIVIGNILSTAYNVPIGYNEVNTSISSLSVEFNNTQMITLQNIGILFLRNEPYQGVNRYRINLGVSLNFAVSGAKDGLLFVTRVADELLRQVGEVCDPYVKYTETEAGIALVNNQIDIIISNFVEAGEVIESGTVLTAFETDDIYSLGVSGTIQPVKCNIAIDIDTLIQ